MRDLGPCAFCGRPAKGEVELVVYQQVRCVWPACDAHAACFAAERITLTVRCMDTNWTVVHEGLFGHRVP